MPDRIISGYELGKPRYELHLSNELCQSCRRRTKSRCDQRTDHATTQDQPTGLQNRPSGRRRDLGAEVPANPAWRTLLVVVRRAWGGERRSALSAKPAQPGRILETTRGRDRWGIYDCRGCPHYSILGLALARSCTAFLETRNNTKKPAEPASPINPPPIQMAFGEIISFNSPPTTGPMPVAAAQVRP